MEENKNKIPKEPLYDERGRIIINDPIEIPSGMTEEETVKFWNTHAMSEEMLEDSFIPEDEEDDLPPPRKTSSTKQVNLRIEKDLLDRLQNLAAIKNVPYQTLLKQFVVERVYEEEKREKVF
ncbi:CopG family antitoxin [Neobacillus sp. SM06]|uniref:CopG family antitoxin n=1 Tax=Neobacillus sp. SM06 TaxID=3422492 RepID=UPI003D27AFA5